MESKPIHLFVGLLQAVLSYVHFESLHLSFFAVVIILVHVPTCHLLLRTIWCRLFAIIKSFQHSSIGTCFGQQEIVLENTIVLSRLLLVRVELSWSIILKVGHEPRVGLIHDIIVVRSALLWRIVKARGSGVGVGAEARLDLTLILIVLALARDGSSPVGELASGIWLVWLVESVGMTISCRFSSSANGRVVPRRYLRTKLTIVKIGDVAQGANVLIVD